MLAFAAFPSPCRRYAAKTTAPAPAPAQSPGIGVADAILATAVSAKGGKVAGDG